MSLSLYDFNALPLNVRANALWGGGTFIAASDHPEGRSAWYTFADYFVEVVMREGDFTKAMAEERPMQIAEVMPFYTGPRLERLLSVIDLAKL